MAKKAMLCILDGFGLRDETHGNAVKLAKHENFDYLWNHYPHSKLVASGTLVGLPEGQMGNSEVGHLNIGAGRIVYQPLELINSKIKDGTFFQNEELLSVLNHVKENQSSLHLFGLLSDGGVHSHIRHLFALIDLCKQQNITNVYYHVFLDGRDTLPDVGIQYLRQLDEKIKETGVGKIATISGRYYAMDRDNRWDRVQKAYDVIVNNKGEHYANYEECIQHNDANHITDEFVVPAVIDEAGMVKDGDGLIAFNFRPDRLRELFMALTNPNFNEFSHTTFQNVQLVTMMAVSEDVITTNAFHSEKIVNTLGDYISSCGLKQLRIAETEKYAHVTYFFDGGIDKEIPGCTRKLIPSPKVATYDLKPEMSANEICDELLQIIDQFDLVILNFANCDMVGHTGVLDAAIKAVETVDYNLGRIMKKTEEIGMTLFVTADHGNCEEMLDDQGNVLTAHTTNLVPFIVTDSSYQLKDGKLGDIAPTILKAMGLSKPAEMTGDELI